MRKTYRLIQVAVALLRQPDSEHYGWDLSRTVGIRSGTMYPLLTRMLDEGWLTDGWEDIDPAIARRPRRRFYRLTSEGQNQLLAIVKEVGLIEHLEN